MLPCLVDLFVFVPTLAAMPFVMLTLALSDPIGFALNVPTAGLQVLAALGLAWAYSLPQRMLLCPLDFVPFLPG